MAFADTFVKFFCSASITLLILLPNIITLCINYSTDESGLVRHMDMDEFQRFRAASENLAIEEFTSATFLLGPLIRMKTTEKEHGVALPPGHSGPYSIKRVQPTPRLTKRALLGHNEVGIEIMRNPASRLPDKTVTRYVWGGIRHVSLFGFVNPGIEWLHFGLLALLMLPAIFIGTKPLIALVALLGMAGSLLYAGLLLTLPCYALAVLLAYRLVDRSHPNGLVSIISAVGRKGGGVGGLGVQAFGQNTPGSPLLPPAEVVSLPPASYRPGYPDLSQGSTGFASPVPFG